MPTVLIRGNVAGSGEVFELRGFATQAVTSIFVEGAILGKETEVPITVAGETTPPPPVLSARIVGAPVSAQESTTITTLEAELVDEDNNVVELYDAANWTWAVDSGGGSFGGPDGDDLTLPSAPATVAISATHNTESLVATASISVVAAVTFSPDFFSLPSQIIEGQQSNPLRSRVLASDGSTAEEIQTNWSYSIVSGPGTIGGSIGNNVLNADPGSAGSSITVRATYIGSLNVSPATDDATTSVVAQPEPGDFPEVLEPAGMTQAVSLDGSTLNWGAGWNPSAGWSDTNRIEVVSDPLSKFGNAIEKRGFVGDTSGWLGALNVGQNVFGSWREVYVRYVWRLSSNWDYHSAGDKLFYWGRKVPGAGATQYFLLQQPSSGLKFISQPGAPGGQHSGGIGLASAFFVPNPSIPSLARDEYHTVELLHRMNSAPGNADGGIRVAIDGSEILTWNHQGQGGPFDITDGVEWIDNSGGATWPALELTGGEFFLFWGGQGDTKTANDFIRLSELYVSGRD